MRAAWIGGWVLTALLVITGLVSCLLGIWTRSEQWGWTSGLAALLCFMAIPFMAMWTSESMPEPRMPRADRKRLRDEQHRIALEAAILRAERAAGIQGGQR